MPEPVKLPRGKEYCYQNLLPESATTSASTTRVIM